MAPYARLGKEASAGVLNADRKLVYFMARSIQLASDAAALSGPKSGPTAALEGPSKLA